MPSTSSCNPSSLSNLITAFLIGSTLARPLSIGADVPDNSLQTLNSRRELLNDLFNGSNSASTDSRSDISITLRQNKHESATPAGGASFETVVAAITAIDPKAEVIELTKEEGLKLLESVKRHEEDGQTPQTAHTCDNCTKVIDVLQLEHRARRSTENGTRSSDNHLSGCDSADAEGPFPTWAKILLACGVTIIIIGGAFFGCLYYFTR